MEFSTYNESSLHHTLKLLYAETYNGQVEVSSDGYIYDIVTKNGNIIEIQTKNLSQLYNKICDAINKGRNIKVVHPIPLKKIIKTYDEKGTLISKRTSPVKGCIYDIFYELTKIYPCLLNKNFSLEIVEIYITEERIQTAAPVQSKNKKRRFKKNWLKTDKKLDEIIETKILKTSEDYINLLPQNLPEEFCSKDLQIALKKEKMATSRIYKNCNIITWVLSNMGIIKKVKIKNRSNYFKILK